MKIRFLNPTSTAHTATLTITAAAYTTSLGSTSLAVTPSSSQISFPAAGEAEKTLTISGLPNYVAKGDLQISFTLIGNASLSGGVGTTLYQTESSPLGIQNPVWRNVLDDACIWALGQSGETDCRWWTTFKLFHSMVFVYDPEGVYYSIRPQDVDDQFTYEYDLIELFENRAESGWVNGDCRDVSNYLCILFMSLGISGSPLQHFAIDGNFVVGFFTNLLCGIGNDATQWTNYGEFPFTFHQTSYSSSLVYDPTCAQWRDLSGAAYQNPPGGWSLNGYWQTAWGGAPSGESDYLGFANRYGWSTDPEGEPVERVSFPVTLRGYTDN